jgi:murein DD-endopeptidase MepM/ murein hydrolase activator NlpD
MAKRGVVPLLAPFIVVMVVMSVLTGTAEANEGADEPVASAAESTDGQATAEDPTDPSSDVLEEVLPVVRPIVFPVVGPTSYSAGFGDCRDGCTRLHEGIDILTHGWKGFPVIAAHNGVVTRINFDGEKSGCSVAITDAEGWTTRYLHLNTDFPGTDYPIDLCFAPGIEPGAPVLAGTIVGWVGDTGNAEGTVPHLHFEIRDPEGTAVDAWPSLEAAHHISFQWIGLGDSLDVMAAAFRDRQLTLHVVDATELGSIVNGASTALTLDVPLVVYDPHDPTDARELIRNLEPERIVVLSASGIPSYLDDLRSLAPIVEMSSLGMVSDEPVTPLEAPTIVSVGDASGEDEDDATHTHVAVGARYVVMVASRGGRDIDAVTSGVSSDVVPVLVPGRGLPGDLGTEAIDLPGPDARTDGLWWLTADGWRFSQDPAVPPDRGIAYLPSGQLDAPTLAFLLSNATAPAMPIWNHQPTSRASKSL